MHLGGKNKKKISLGPSTPQWTNRYMILNFQKKKKTFFCYLNHVEHEKFSEI
jgi:hypothetical protein